MFCNDSLPTVWYIGQVNFLVYGQHQYCIVSTNTLQTPGYDSIVYSLIITGQIDIYIFAQLPFLRPICHLHLNSNCKFAFTQLGIIIYASTSTILPRTEMILARFSKKTRQTLHFFLFIQSDQEKQQLIGRKAPAINRVSVA